MKIETQLRFYKPFATLTPEMHYSGYVVTDGSWHQEPLYASYSRLYYVTHGSGMLVSENEKMPLEPGYVYLVPCGIKCGFYGTPSVTKLFFHINLSVNGEGCEGSDAFESFGHFSRLPRSVEYIEKLKDWYLGNGSESENYGYLMLKSEIIKTVCDFLRTKEVRSEKTETYSKAVADAMRYVRSHITATLTVKSVAEAALCSQSKLSALFKAELGQSVSSYIEDILMSEAQTQLMYSDLSVGQISEKLGFCDQFYFSRRFKKRFGVPPKEFKKSQSV